MTLNQDGQDGVTLPSPLSDIAQAVVDLMPKKVAQLTQAALDQGITPRKVLLDGLAPGMKRVGKLFAAQEFFVPEVLLASRAFEAGMAVVKSLLGPGSTLSQGRILLGVVPGDIHDIGKNIVRVLLEADGFDVIDLGKDVPLAEFVRVTAERQPDVVGMSSLMTTTMPLMKDVTDALTQAGLRDKVKVIVGGAPLTEDYARQIGADGYAPDASGAVQLVRRLLAATAKGGLWRSNASTRFLTG
jgi:5-methyltetrahydrofolate--homocysteine methyltransferase